MHTRWNKRSDIKVGSDFYVTLSYKQGREQHTNSVVTMCAR